MKRTILYLSAIGIICINIGWPLFCSSQCTTCLMHITTGNDTLCNTTDLNWAKWTSVSSTTASGIISSSINVSVTQSAGGLFTTGGMFSGGTFPSIYKVPISTTSIANQYAGVFKVCFSKPVTNPQIAFASIGTSGKAVQINTSVPYCIIWPGVAMTYLSDTSFIGKEGYTIIRFPGTHSCISFDYLQSEYYINMAFGIQDTSCQVTPPKVCTGDPVTLKASGGTSYKWSPSTGLNTDTGATVIANPSVTTTYYVTDGNCKDSILVTVNPLLVVSPDTAFCEGNATQLQASGGTTYSWLPTTGLSDPAIANPIAYPSMTTTYTVSVSPAPCMDSTATVTITVFPTPPTPNIERSNDTLYCSYDSSYISYQWYADNVLVPGATGAFYVAGSNGNFNVAVTSKDGCMISVGIIVLGIENMNEQSFSVNPNPASDRLWINGLLGDKDNASVAIINVLGQEVIVIRQTKDEYIDIAQLPSGTYFLQFISGKGRAMKMFLKE